MELFYRKTGSGPPLIVLHGLYGSSDNWMTVAGLLSSKYSVYIPDLRNHGQSPHHPDHNYTVMCNDMGEFFDRHIRGKCILLGHSMGGKLAVTFAALHPERIAAMIVADISPFHSPGRQDSITSFHRKVLDAMPEATNATTTSRGVAEKLLAERIGDIKVASFLMKNLVRNQTGGFRWKLNIQALSQNLESIMDRAPVPEKANITGFPVLFVRGGDSGYLPESHFPEIEKVFPAAGFITIGGTGHWLHAEKPGEFAKVIIDFLT